jgi:5'-methylthioadenosine phosphorylase
MSEHTAKIGVIGGSGLYDIPGAKVVAEVRPDTPWGDPSDAITLAEFGEHIVAFLPRHGRGHRVLPSLVNSRANLCALKILGVEQVVAFSAVGSLKEELKPLDFVVPTQVIDRTRHRPDTYFGEGIVGHVAFADPFCNDQAEMCRNVIESQNLPRSGAAETLVCMEGPLFSTRAESNLYRSWGAGLINMSVLPEAKLAREAELCYTLICMVTDYDCWRDSEQDVDIQMVIANLTQNADRARNLLVELIPAITGRDRSCSCCNACENAIITARESWPAQTVQALKVLLPRYFNAG